MKKYDSDFYLEVMFGNELSFGVGCFSPFTHHPKESCMQLHIIHAYIFLADHFKPTDHKQNVLVGPTASRDCNLLWMTGSCKSLFKTCQVQREYLLIIYF
jgi:hypothetical protein